MSQNDKKMKKMNPYLKYSLGIDVSKDLLCVCLSVIDHNQRVSVKGSRQFPNTAKGFEQLLAWLGKQLKMPLPLTVLLEATGIYHEQLAWFLHGKGYALSIILPNKAKSYARALGLKSKNDKIDAAGLARMGAEQSLPLWQPCSRHLHRLKMLTRHYEKLQAMRTALRNQLHALTHGFEPEPTVVKSHQKLIKTVEQQLDQAEQGILALVRQDQALQEKVEKVASSVKGLGPLTVITLVAETAGFSTIDNQRQLTSYAGYDVVENQSGQRAGKTKISKRGNSHIRRSLHMPALNMVRYGVKPFAALYERVYQRTGVKMKGYTAIQRKLLLLVYTLWKKDQAYDESYYNKEEETSGVGQAKPLFPLACQAGPKNSPGQAGATQDGLPSAVSAEALFPLLQS
jgi:transposase